MGLPERLRAIALLSAFTATLGPVIASAAQRPVDVLEAAKAHIRQKNFTAATTELQHLATAGNRDAQYLLAVLYLNGLNGPRDPIKAHDWLEKSARQGNARAAASLSALTAESAGADLAQVEVADPRTRAEALWLAAAEGDLPRLRAVADKQAIESHDAFGRGALARAAEAGHAAAVSFLIGQGASVD
jgi:TPR repeat protein